MISSALYPLMRSAPAFQVSDVALRVEQEDGVVGGPFDQQPKLVGFVLRPLLVLEQFNEPTHLGLEDDRQQRLHQEVHRTERIPLFHLRAVDVAGGEKDDRRVPGAVVGPDQPWPSRTR